MPDAGCRMPDAAKWYFHPHVNDLPIGAFDLSSRRSRRLTRIISLCESALSASSAGKNGWMSRPQAIPKHQAVVARRQGIESLRP
jgi:hypothetical protein